MAIPFSRNVFLITSQSSMSVLRERRTITMTARLSKLPSPASRRRRIMAGRASTVSPEMPASSYSSCSQPRCSHRSVVCASGHRDRSVVSDQPWIPGRGWRLSSVPLLASSVCRSFSRHRGTTLGSPGYAHLVSREYRSLESKGRRYAVVLAEAGGTQRRCPSAHRRRNVAADQESPHAPSTCPLSVACSCVPMPPGLRADV